MQQVHENTGGTAGSAYATGITVEGTGDAVRNAPKAELSKRFIAAVIDGVVAAVLSVIPVVGGLVAAAYMVVRDGLDVDFMKNRSLGKKVMKLRPLGMDGRPVDLAMSVRRNWMFGIGALTGVLIYIPILGWALIPIVGLIGLAIGIYEIYRVVTDPGGRRWGDQMAGTKVIEVAD